MDRLHPHSDADSDVDGHSDSRADGDGDSAPHADTDSKANDHTDPDTHADRDFDEGPDADTEADGHSYSCPELGLRRLLLPGAKGLLPPSGQVVLLRPVLRDERRLLYQLWSGLFVERAKALRSA